MRNFRAQRKRDTLKSYAEHGRDRWPPPLLFSWAFNAVHLLFSFSSVLLLTTAPLAEAQPGFISIDCGGASAFTSVANITWVLDDDYITTGKAAILPNPGNLSTGLQTVRYFPEPFPKNCYQLSPVQEGSSYIVRASFYYGNFDNKGTMPQFSLIVDATLMVDTVQDNSYYEIYVPAKSNVISVCLARNVASAVAGDPFISLLELRSLPPQTSYEIAALQQGFGLFGIYCTNLGSTNSSYLRYPNDMLDRIWAPYAAPGNTSLATTHEVVASKERNIDYPPLIMLQTALSGTESPYSMTGLSSESTYLVIMHFSEISPNVTGPGQRVFDIYTNFWEQGTLPWVPNIDIYSLSGGQFMGAELYSTPLVSPVNDSIVLSFKSSLNSTEGPIISGIQVLHRTAEPLSNLTFADDARTIQDIRDYYAINGSFGDPCMPVNYSWTWISCEQPEGMHRITSISLSGLALKGVIHNQISKLLALTEIHLDGNDLTGMVPEFNFLSELEVINLRNNRLTGQIPEFTWLKKLRTLDFQNNRLSGPIPASLSTLPSLKELFLGNNQFEGEVPPSLLAKSKAGTLNLTFEGNTKLTCNGEPCLLSMAPPPSLIDSPPPPPNETQSTSHATPPKTWPKSSIYMLIVLLFQIQAL